MSVKSTHTTVAEESWQSSTARPKRYFKQRGFFQNAVWRVWIWLETTFALSLMEPWEVILVFLVTGIMTLLLIIALVRYFPQSLITASKRAHYYIFGSDSSTFVDDIWMKGRVEM